MATIKGFDHLNLGKQSKQTQAKPQQNLPTYQSKSKGTIVIRDMHSKHIVNAIRSQLIKHVASLLQTCDSVDEMNDVLYELSFASTLQNQTIFDLFKELEQRGEGL